MAAPTLTRTRLRPFGPRPRLALPVPLAPAARRLGRSQAVAYLLPALLAAVVTLTWFEPGTFIGSGDVSPLVRRGAAAELGSLWNHHQTGAGGTATTAAASIDVGFVRVAEVFGASALVAQRALFVTVIAIAAVGGVHAARLVTRTRWAAGAAGVLAVFNPYVLVNAPNLIFPLAVGATGLLVGEVVAQARTGRHSVARLALVSLPLAYLSTNPPLLVLAAGAAAFAAAAAMVGRHRRPGRTAWLLVKAAPVLVLVHAWWIVPFVQVNLLGADGAAFAAVTDVTQWRWVHVNNQLERVATLTAHWAWYERSFFPWVPTLERPLWWPLRLVLPVGALLGAVAAPRHLRRPTLLLAGSAVALIALSQGLEDPARPLNELLYAHAPGWWLFRDPVTKFGAPLVIAYVALFASFLERAAHLIRHRFRVDRPALVLTPLVVAAAAFPLPLLTGEVVPSSRPGLPSAHVAVPPEWDQIGDVVSSSDRYGKVLVVPLNRYYQVTTSWGYHGVDLAPQLFDRPVLQLLPGGYFTERPAYEDLLRRAERALVVGDVEAASAVAASLGATHVVVRRDVEPGPLHVRYPDVEAMAATARSLPGAEVVHEGAVATVVELTGSAGMVSIHPSLVAAGPRDATAAVAASRGPVVVGDHPVDGVTLSSGAVSGPVTVEVAPAPAHVLTVDLPDRIAVTPALTGDPARWTLGSEAALTIDGDPVEVQPLVEIPWPTGDGIEPLALIGHGTLQAPLEPFEVRAGEQVTLGAFGEARPLTGDGSVGDCNRYDARSLDEVGIAAEWHDPSTVTLRASDRSACAVFAVPTAPLTAEVLVPYAVARGRGARACLWDEQARTCRSEGFSTGAHGELRLAQPGGVDGLQLFVYGDASDAPALVRYGPVVVRDFVASGTAVVPDRLSGPIEVGPGVRHLEATGGGRTSVLGEWGGLENCHAFDARTADEVGLGLVRIGPEVELRADAHSACLIATVDAGPGDVLELTLEHRTLAGGAARVCVWMDGPNQCAETEALVHSAGWERLDAPVTVAPGTTAVRLYLYADGLDDGTTTVVQYRHVDLRRADHTRFSITPVDDTPAPGILAERATPGRWHVAVNGLDGPALLTLHESHAQGWRIDGLPTGWTADPVTVDGWAMGWLITGSGDGALTMAFGSALDARTSFAVSLATLLVVIAYAGWRRVDVPALYRARRPPTR